MPNSRKNRVTLFEIAQASGVSLTSVSLALSDKPGISQETRARVLNAARVLGYRFKTPAISSPVKTIRTIGLLLGLRADDQPYVSHFYSHIIAGIEATCRQMGLNLMFMHVLVDSENAPIDLPGLLENEDVDGFILAGLFVDEKTARVLNHRANPVVLFESYSKTHAYSAVLYDNFKGAYLATEYLIQKGHRQIGFVGGHSKDYPSFRDRRNGYQQAIADHEIEQTYFAEYSVYSALQNEVAETVLDLIHSHRQITGLVCVTDDAAITVMNALHEAGCLIPQDISVIGFDDIYMAESVIPPLTTMRVNKQSMGQLAVQILMNQVFQENGETVTSLFCPSLVERNSVMAIDPNGRQHMEIGGQP